MDMETWFAPAIELGQLVKEYREAAPGEKQRLEWQIRNSDYLSRLHILQSYSGAGFLQGLLPEEKINVIRKDFFYESGNAVSAAGRRKTLSDALSPA